jgi:pyruvate formate lyase activating enzyme
LRIWPIWTKLDTNGSRPDVLRDVLAHDLIDGVALDIKTPPERYAELAGLQVKVEDVEASIALLNHSRVDNEFRTTVVAGFHQEVDIIKIAQWIVPAQHYVLQRFRPQVTLDPAWQKFSCPSEDELETWAKRVRHWIPDVTLR